MLYSLLKSEDLIKNKKKTYRLYCEEKRQVRTKKRGKIHRQRVPLLLPSNVNERWLIGQLISISISGQQVARF